MSKLTGLSLSFCVLDIARGLVPLADVEKIIAGTRAESVEKFESVFQRYAQSFWHSAPEQCVQIARTLMESGRIDQPRLRGEENRLVFNETPGAKYRCWYWKKDGQFVEYWQNDVED